MAWVLRLGQSLVHLHDPILYGEEAVQQDGVEQPALAGTDHLQHHFPGKSRLIHPLAAQRVVYVRQGHDLSPWGDLLPLQSLGIAPAVPPLMVVQRNVPGVFVDPVVLQLRDAVQKHRALRGVGLHDLVLLGGKLPRLGEHRVRNGDLAHVVHDGGEGDPLDLVAAQLPGEIGMLQHIPGDLGDALDVAARLLVAKFNGGGQRLDHASVQLDDPVGLSQQLHLLGLHHLAQMLSGLEQLDHGGHAAQYHIGYHRLLDHVHNAQLIRLFDDALAALRRDKKHRDLIQQPQLFQPLKHFNAVHFGHHHVQQDGAEGVVGTQQHLKSLPPVHRLLHIIGGREDLAQDRPVDGVVVHDQNRLPAAGRRGECISFHLQAHPFPSELYSFT